MQKHDTCYQTTKRQHPIGAISSLIPPLHHLASATYIEELDLSDECQHLSYSPYPLPSPFPATRMKER